MNKPPTRHFACVVASTGLLFVLAACGSDEAATSKDTSPASQTNRNERIYDALPDSVKEAGVIVAATEPGYPPFEIIGDDGELIGADIDLSAALSDVLGVKIENKQTEFAAIIPGLQSQRFDVGISSIGDYVEREAIVDFIDYYSGGTSFLVRSGEPEPATILDVCGKTVGVQQGTASQTMAEDGSKECTDSGKEAIVVKAFPTQNDAVLALTAGRIDMVSADSATNGYSAKQIGDSVVSGGLSVYKDRPYYGIAVPKDSELYQPLFDAMTEVMESGEYMRIMEEWGLEDGAIDKPLKNQGICPC